MMIGVLLAIVMSQPAPSTSSIVADSWKRTQVIGHRGAAAHAPENTLEGFRTVIASGAAATECDVHTDADGNLVVIHDAMLDRTTAGKGRVKEQTSPEIRALGVPFLDDVTAVTKDKIVLVVEIKDGADVARKVVEHLVSRQMVDQSIVFSFNLAFVTQVKALNPKQFAVWLVAGKPALEKTFDQVAAARADAIGFAYQSVTLEMVAEAHRRKLPVFAWTVSPGPEVVRLRDMNVNFIITDHPREVVEQLGKLGRGPSQL